MTVPVYFAPLMGLVGLGYAAYLAFSILGLGAGTEKMKAIASAIQEGATAYLNRQYRTIAIIAAALAILITLAINLQTTIAFLLGAAMSAAAGYLGMNISVRTNVRTANAASEGSRRPSQWHSRAAQ